MLRPAKKNHSIVEAAFSFFLLNELKDPSSFKELLKNELKDFQEFNPLITGKIGLSISKNKVDIINDSSHDINGFLISKFLNGEKDFVIRSQNKVDKNDKNYISVHDLNYNSWKNFKENFTKYFKIIDKHSPNLIVEAFNLSYVDKFYWEDSSFPNLKDILKSDSSYIPNECLSSKSLWNYSLTIQLEENNNKVDNSPPLLFNDRLNIAISKEKEDLFSIAIIHNVTHKLTEFIQLINIFTDNIFNEALEVAHTHNKKILKSILNDSTQKLIRLT